MIINSLTARSTKKRGRKKDFCDLFCDFSDLFFLFSDLFCDFCDLFFLFSDLKKDFSDLFFSFCDLIFIFYDLKNLNLQGEIFCPSPIILTSIAHYFIWEKENTDSIKCFACIQKNHRNQEESGKPKNNKFQLMGNHCFSDPSK